MPVKNVCDCDNPPGGQARCEPHQMAVCRAVAGQCLTECRDPPRNAISRIEIEAWAYAVITGERVVSPLPRAARAILARGRYVNPDTGEVVTFTLPKHRPHNPGSDRSDPPDFLGGGGSSSRERELVPGSSSRAIAHRQRKLSRSPSES